MVGHQRQIAVISHDMFMVFLSWTLAYATRYEITLTWIQWTTLIQILPVVLLVQGFIFWQLGLYKGLWRFASIPDLWNIIRATVLGVLSISLVLFLMNRLDGIPRTSLVLYPVFLTFLLGAPRLIYRMWKDHTLRVFQSANRIRVLILGAGSAGEALAREMIREGTYVPIGYLDDEEKVKGAKLYGIPVLGTTEMMAKIVEAKDVDVVVIAIPSATSVQMQNMVLKCEQARVPFRTLPRFQDLVSGKVSLDELREVAIEDLLGREPVSLDWQKINKGLTGKTVLISGGGGSIGSELCRQIVRLGPNALIILERSEYNLYRIEMELKRQNPDIVLHAYLGDVGDEATVEHILSTHKPDTIFHAAAYKHVPLLEHQARQAVKNNVLGTRTLALAADRHNCSTFILISTDKAVNPANVMGSTKRIAEIFCQKFNQHSRTNFMAVRFGNVLDSAGSVVPLFRKQISEGGPVTVTHPEIVRYFMTIPEACQLIMQAAVMGKGGEIFVLDMGEPIRIAFLAEQMIKLSGKTAGEDIEIVFTGLRPGEKLYEELFYQDEDLSSTGHKKIMLTTSGDVDWNMLNKAVDKMFEACEQFNEPSLKEQISNLVPKSEKTAGIPTDNVVRLEQMNK